MQTHIIVEFLHEFIWFLYDFWHFDSSRCATSFIISNYADKRFYLRRLGFRSWGFSGTCCGNSGCRFYNRLFRDEPLNKAKTMSGKVNYSLVDIIFIMVLILCYAFIAKDCPRYNSGISP